jgi:hypothetical protein
MERLSGFLNAESSHPVTRHRVALWAKLPTSVQQVSRPELARLSERDRRAFPAISVRAGNKDV